VDTTNVWQFGMSPKIIFDSVVGFVTDTINSYPVNTKSILEYKMPAWWYEHPILMFEHKYESDSLNDGGYIQFSYDHGQNWHYLGGDPWETSSIFVYAYYNYPNMYGPIQSTIHDTLSAFTGNNGWMWSAIQFNLPVVMQGDESFKTGGQIPDTLYFRFIFESDSIDSGKAGWMIRNIVIAHANDNGWGAVEENSLEKQLFYPNPAKDRITLNFDQSVDIQKVILYDIANKQTELNLTDNIIATDNIPNGIYHIHFVTDKETYHSRLLIIH
jgi:hypothetical protein